jgi:hypothetical protein
MRNNHLLLKKQSFTAAAGGLAGPWSIEHIQNRIC